MTEIYFNNANSFVQRAHSSLIKWVSAAATALATTIALIALMHILIATPRVAMPTVTERPRIDFVLKEPTIETLKVAPLPPKPVVAEQQPVLPPLDYEVIEGGEGGFLAPAPSAPTGNPSPVSLMSAFPVARLMVAPDYPLTAARSGIEGYVDVRFDVSKTGATMNAEIIASEPEKIFDKSALRAIERWKFMPYESNGEVIEFYGMSRRLLFKLED
ncbi:MAG TPA: TonB family protein [Marinagarivorans sp.]